MLARNDDKGLVLRGGNNDAFKWDMVDASKERRQRTSRANSRRSDAASIHQGHLKALEFPPSSTSFAKTHQNFVAQYLKYLFSITAT